jgi:predicted amidophosphoribosyltransferase
MKKSLCKKCGKTIESKTKRKQYCEKCKLLVERIRNKKRGQTKERKKYQQQYRLRHPD